MTNLQREADNGHRAEGAGKEGGATMWSKENKTPRVGQSHRQPKARHWP